MFMPKRYFGIFIVFALLWGGTKTVPVEGADEATITLVTGEWPPYTGEALNGGGIAVKLVKAVFAEMGRAVDIQFYPWRRCEAYVQRGKAWAAFPYAFTAERRTQYLFSDALFETGNAWFYYGEKMNSVEYEEIADLRPYKIGVATGYWYEKWLRQAGLRIDESTDDLTALRKLQAGRIDLFPLEQRVGMWLINQHFPEHRQHFGTLKQSLHAHEHGLIVAKSYPNSRTLLREFNEALQRVKTKGIDQRILQSYAVQRKASRPDFLESQKR